ncbi:MAG: PaaI family thioesterase [Pseudomonadota bacterium]
MHPKSDPEAEAILREISLGKGFNGWLQMELIRAGHGSCEVAIPIAPPTRQHHGFAHGGVVGALADIATTWAAATLAGDVVTNAYTIQFLAPATEDRLLARGEVIKRGKRTVSVEGRVFSVAQSGEEKLVAVSLASITPVGPG